MSAPKDLRERMETHQGFQFRVTSYELNGRFVAKADNVDPGAVIARAEGDTREAAEETVIETSRRRLGRTRVFPTD
jgi:hypothetical protein